MGRGIRIAAGLVALVAATSSIAGGTMRLTAAQTAEVEQRWALAQQIVARLVPDAARMELAPEWRQATMTLLLANSSAKLALIAKSGGSYEQVIARANDRGAASQKLLGDATDDLVFKPFIPCRYIDTRFVGGKISGIRAFNIAGLGGCDPVTLAGVSSAAEIGAIAFNIAIVDTSAGAPGFLTVRPAGSTQLTTMLNWWQASVSAQDSNAAVSAINQAGPNEFEILTSGPVHVIMDLLGAFVSPHATALDCTTAATPSGSSATGDVAAGAGAAFVASCPVGYTITGGGCAFFTTAQQPPAITDNKVLINRSQRVFDNVSQTFVNQWVCQWTNTDSITWRVQTRAVCCRTPGR
jgi:hypothetical protein